MQSSPELTLLLGNGYKALAGTNNGQERRPFLAGLHEKMARAGDGDVDTTADLADRGPGPVAYLRWTCAEVKRRVKGE